MDPISLVSGGLEGGLTGPSSSASNDGTMASPFNVNFTEVGSGNTASGGSVSLWIGMGLLALVLLKRRR